MNKTQIRNFTRLGMDFQRQWLEGLKQESGQAAVSAFADMLQFSATCEGAMAELGKLAADYPLDCVRAIVFAMYGSDQAFTLGLHTLSGIDKDKRNQAFRGISEIWCQEDPERWSKYVQKVRRALKKL